MTTNRATSLKFAILAALILAGASASLASLWPAALGAARQQSAKLVGEAAHASGPEAEVDYRLATWLDPANQPAYAGLAGAQILAGRPDDALASLAKAGEGSEVVQLKVRTLIELGRYNQAATEAAALTVPGRSDNDVVLAALAMALAGRPADAQALTTRVTSPEALQSVQRASAGTITLAGELYATGLLQSSSALLMKLPTSYERNLLLGRIHYMRHSSNDLAQAADFLTLATALNPAATESRSLLAKVYSDQNKPAEAAHQKVLIDKIQSGRP